MKKQQNKIDGLWELIGDLDLWITAYKKLDPNRDLEFIKEGKISTDELYLIKTLRDAVITGEFKFGNKQKFYVADGSSGLIKLKTLKDLNNVVPQVIRDILEPIYVLHFFDNSHGFLPDTSEHTCLRQVEKNFNGADWYIKADVSECFNRIKAKKVKKLLKRKIDDEQFLDFVEKGLRRPLIVIKRKQKTEWTVGQSTKNDISSKLLSEIVLYQLDRLVIKIRNLLSKSASQASKNSPKNIGIQYSRHGHVFIVGVTGPPELVKRIKSILRGFLYNILGLDVTVQQIETFKNTEKIPLLGYLIDGRTLTYHPNYNEIFEGLSEKGFCTNEGKPLANLKYLSCSESVAVSRCSALVKKIQDYYKLLDKRQQRELTQKIEKVLEESLAETSKLIEFIEKE
jgi:hypothetical protein